jgi:Spy/CpxP family protein refolding chaperone
MKRLVTLTLTLLVATAALAGSGAAPMGKPRMGGLGMGGSMDRNLFPPELVLMNQIALGLSEAQVDAIKKLVGEMQGGMLDIKTDLHRVTEQLGATLDSTKVDEAAALGFASQAMDLEKRVKTAHLTLLIRVKNLLTGEQQEKARALKPDRDVRIERERMGPPSGD